MKTGWSPPTSASAEQGWPFEENRNPCSPPAQLEYRKTVLPVTFAPSFSVKFKCRRIHFGCVWSDDQSMGLSIIVGDELSAFRTEARSVWCANKFA